MQHPTPDNNPANGSSTERSGSDANWSPQQQTARMLALCEAQLEAATQDSDSAVETLVKACTDMMSMVSDISHKAKECKSADEQKTLLTELSSRTDAMSKDVAAAVVAFQFYDKLSQRLGHVRYSMSTLALFICDRASSQRPDQWDRLLMQLGRLYRTAEERAIFDSVVHSLALTISNEDSATLSKEMSNAGSIELF